MIASDPSSRPGAERPCWFGGRPGEARGATRVSPWGGQPAGRREAGVVTAQWLAPAGFHTPSAGLPVEGALPSFDGATGWLNSPPLRPDEQRGKVVLVNFWTYTCINWLRQLPYVRAWAERYGGLGLVVLGVHTPEFAFEHDADNVRRAVKNMRIEYPVATDNDYEVW